MQNQKDEIGSRKSIQKERGDRTEVQKVVTECLESAGCPSTAKSQRAIHPQPRVSGAVYPQPRVSGAIHPQPRVSRMSIHA